MDAIWRALENHLEVLWPDEVSSSGYRETERWDQMPNSGSVTSRLLGFLKIGDLKSEKKKNDLSLHENVRSFPLLTRMYISFRSSK